MPEGTARSRRKCSFLSIEPNPNSFDLLAAERTGDAEALKSTPSMPT
jgi:hypothetical protein